MKMKIPSFKKFHFHHIESDFSIKTFQSQVPVHSISAAIGLSLMHETVEKVEMVKKFAGEEAQIAE